MSYRSLHTIIKERANWKPGSLEENEKPHERIAKDVIDMAKDKKYGKDTKDMLKMAKALETGDPKKIAQAASQVDSDSSYTVMMDLRRDDQKLADKIEKEFEKISEEYIDEKAVSNKPDEDYDAQKVPEIDPGKKTANTADHKDNVSSVETKGTNDSIAEADSKAATEFGKKLAKQGKDKKEAEREIKSKFRSVYDHSAAMAEFNKYSKSDDKSKDSGKKVTYTDKKEWTKALDKKYGRNKIRMKPAVDGAMAVTGLGNDMRIVGNWSDDKGKGTVMEEVETEEQSTFSEDSLNQLTRLFGGQPKPLTEAKEDDKKKKGKKNPEKANDKIDTTPEVDDEQPVGEEVVNEEELSDAQEKKKEEIVKKLKEKKDEFQKKYGDRWESVMYATATKMAKKAVGESIDKSLEKRAQAARSANAKSQYSAAEKMRKRKERNKKKKANEELEEGYPKRGWSSKPPARGVSKGRGPWGGSDKEKARTKAVKADSKGAVEREKQRRKKAMDALKKESYELTEEDKARYNKVFNAVAKHMNVDPKAIDELDKDKKKEFFDTVDKCWDPKEDKVPDGCPVDINLE